MFGPIKRKGFCRGCVQNLCLVRQIDSRLFRILDWFTLRAVSLLKLGPWKCPYCGTRSFLLTYPIRGIRDFESDQHKDARIEEEMPHGNFIVQRDSLVSIQENEDRFSQKYRDGVAQKILKGEAMISQVCRELNVGERDLTSWVRQYVDQQQQLLSEEIDSLKNFISQANHDTLALRYQEEFAELQSQKEMELTKLDRKFRSLGNVIEGQAKPSVAKPAIE